MSVTVTSLILKVKTNLAEQKAMRYLSSTATSGSSTTIVVSSLASVYPDDTFNGCYARLTSGVGANFKRVLVSDYTGSSGTFTLAESIGFTVTTNTFEVFDVGIWADPDILSWMNDEQKELQILLSDEVQHQIVKRTSTTSSSGFAAYPSAMLRLVKHPEYGLAVEVGDGVVTPIYSPAERMLLNDDAFLTATITEPVAWLSHDGGSVYGIRHHPTTVATVYWTHVPLLSDMTLSGNAGLPDFLTNLLVLGTTCHGFMSSEDFSNATAWKSKRDEQIKLLNQDFAGRSAWT